MKRGHRRGAQSGRKSRSKQVKQSPPEAPDEPRTHPHPRFGPIPLIVREWIDGDGTVRASYDFDPDHQPPMPPGAIRGDPRRQSSRGAFDVPHYYYVDRERHCVQCRYSFVFAAQEQKNWYENLGFNFASVAIRCPACRRQRRSAKALHHAVDDAKRELLKAPDHATAQLALAEAIVELHTRRGHGKLEEALAAARKARKLLRAQPPTARALTHYWEAQAHALAQRTQKARAAFTAFLQLAGPKAHRKQIRTATAWLAATPDEG